MEQDLIERLTEQLAAKGYDDPRASAINILRKQGSVHPDSEELTEGGLVRSQMTPGERAIDRQSKYTGRPKHHFSYNAATNRAPVKRFFKK